MLTSSVPNSVQRKQRLCKYTIAWVLHANATCVSLNIYRRNTQKHTDLPVMTTTKMRPCCLAAFIASGIEPPNQIIFT